MSCIQRKTYFLLMILMLLLSALTGQTRSFNIISSGAVGDGITDNTVVLQRVINEAAKKGGKVVIPKGWFVTGPLTLKSNVHLVFTNGSALLGSVNINDYGSVKAKPLISAVGAENITISGNGIIDGRGGELVKDLLDKLSRGSLKDPEWKLKRPTGKYRPAILKFVACSNISLKGLQIKNSAGWVQSFEACNQVNVDSIRVESTSYWNNDGIDINNCKEVHISNSYFDVTDDAICLKSEGKLGICENVWIKNCVLRSSASGF